MLSVKIDMDIFVKAYQPEKYELWKNGGDNGHHPEDPKNLVEAYQYCSKVMDDAYSEVEGEQLKDETKKVL